MRSTTSIISLLKNKFPDLLFEPAEEFCWSPLKKTVFFDKNSPDLDVLLLHELGHAVLGHDDYITDVELLGMERQAWDKSLEIAVEFDIKITDDFIQSNLDSYRDWLHQRSTCPNCTAVGMQTKKQQYSCPACNHAWQVNEARTCSLRRYNKKRTI